MVSLYFLLKPSNSIVIETEKLSKKELIKREKEYREYLEECARLAAEKWKEYLKASDDSVGRPYFPPIIPTVFY